MCDVPSAEPPRTDPSYNIAAIATMKSTRESVRNAEFPPRDRDASSSGILGRHCLHGGPVTAATLRFPPPPGCMHDGDATAEPDLHQRKEQYGRLKSQGRVVLARGPWIESRPLFPRHYANRCSDEAQREGSLEDSPANGNKDNSESSSNEKDCYSILAFGGENHGSSTIETVSGMIFPSSSSSLAYLNASSSEDAKAGRKRERQPSSLISVVAFGGRRISFLTGGGLWNAEFDESGINAGTRSQSRDFAPMPILRNRDERKDAQRPYLEVSDWIQDVRLRYVESNGPPDAKHQTYSCRIGAFLVAMGMANNNCDIWGFHLLADKGGKGISLSPSRLQCVTCEVRCMTYSLSFYGWGAEADRHIESNALPSLVVASGTVFGEILVWGAHDASATAKDDEESLFAIVKMWQLRETASKSIASGNAVSRIKVRPSYRLKGHLGSVFSVRFGWQGNCVVSTSDDRTVRLWALTPMGAGEEDASRFDCTKSAGDILVQGSSQAYTLVWTGWGHSARVWDVSFASFGSARQAEPSLPLLVSVGEDSVARIWSPLSNKKEICHPLRGHRCESVWTVDVCEGIVITGGNDGCVKLFDLESRVRSKEKSLQSFAVPKDPGPTALDAPKDTSKEKPLSNGDEGSASTGTKSRKKQKRKVKAHGQAVCGMEFYGSGGAVNDKLLVATRAGGLFSLDLRSQGWKDFSSWSGDAVLASNNEEVMNIDPSTGNCMGVHPNGELAVIGTTEGWLVVSSLVRSSAANGQRKSAFRAASHRPAQSVQFLDANNLLVFYARAAIWFRLDSVPAPLHVLAMGANGIPISFAYSAEDQAMYIGDTRGNIFFYDLSQSHRSLEDGSNDVFGQKPNSLLAKTHAKEHVTGLTVLSSGIVVSVGNDGCMQQCIRDANDGHLKKMISIPIPNVTGLRHVWNVLQPNGEEIVIVGGFYGNDFVLLDSVNGYEFCRIDTGGRQRRQDFFFSFSSSNAASIQCPGIFAMAVLASQKDGSNLLDVHCSEGFEESLAMGLARNTGNDQEIYNIGSPVHAETINDACWIKSSGSTFLLTGSNDCTVKLSKLVDSKLLAVMELPPRESCVRGVCTSSHPESEVSLLVTCGGKLGMEFYILQQRPCSNSSSRDICVKSLCSYRTLEKATIDHRMNAVRAIPLAPREETCHLVLSGDSDGNLHLCIVSEHATARRTTIGTILKGTGRPVLCLELLQCGDRILAFVGTTGGDIAVWAFHSRVGQCNGDTEALCLEGTMPDAALHTFKAHQSGVNDLSLALVKSSPISECAFSIIVCSVGDDQALSTCVLSFTDEWHLKRCHSVTRCASGSALKAVHIVPDDGESYRIYTTGHDERITMWQLDANCRQLSVRFLTSSPLGTDGSCIDCIHLRQPDGSTEEVISVGGEGVELQSFNLNTLRAAKKLREANYLLITAGAGFSADSGLQTYECAPAEYRDMCNASKLTDDPHRFQQFWLNFTRSYLETSPHKGYELLDRWCQGGRLPHLKRDGQSTPWWVYSSNVDGHFRLFKSFESSLCAIHGSALEFRCACGIGYSNGEPRLGKQWEDWNQKMRPTQLCKEATVKMDQALVESLADKEEVWLCRHCAQPMRPNVLLFHDSDEHVVGPIGIQRERYQHWEALVEDEVALNGCKLVILDMGCGVNVPAVRQESEEVFLDCAKKIRSQSEEARGSVCLIRINPKDSQSDVGGEESGTEAISITSTAADALREIDRWLRALDRLQQI